MLETNRLILRLMQEEDLEEVRQLHNSSSTLNMLTDPFHVSIEEQKLWFQKLSQSRSNRRYVIISRENDDLVGVIRIDNIDLVNKSLIIGADIVPTYRRQGFATEAYDIIMDYLFRTLGFNRIQLITLKSNQAAIALYQKLGFLHEGLLKEFLFRNGEYQDAVLMALLRKNWNCN